MGSLMKMRGSLIGNSSDPNAHAALMAKIAEAGGIDAFLKAMEIVDVKQLAAVAAQGGDPAQMKAAMAAAAQAPLDTSKGGGTGAAPGPPAEGKSGDTGSSAPEPSSAVQKQ